MIFFILFMFVFIAPFTFFGFDETKKGFFTVSRNLFVFHLCSKAIFQKLYTKYSQKKKKKKFLYITLITNSMSVFFQFHAQKNFFFIFYLLFISLIPLFLFSFFFIFLFLAVKCTIFLFILLQVWQMFRKNILCTQNIY